MPGYSRAYQTFALMFGGDPITFPSPIDVDAKTSTVDGVIPVATFTAHTSGNMAAGFGGEIALDVQDDTASSKLFSFLWGRTTADNVGTFTLAGPAGGSTMLSVLSTGVVVIPEALVINEAGSARDAEAELEVDGVVGLVSQAANPALGPASGVHIYEFGTSLVFQFNVAGVAHYFTLDGSATTDQSLVYSATAPT